MFHTAPSNNQHLSDSAGNEKEITEGTPMDQSAFWQDILGNDDLFYKIFVSCRLPY